MNPADLSAPMSFDEFLTWRENVPGDGRYELIDGEPFALAAEKNRHILVKVDVCLALRRAVRSAGSPCTVLGDGATVEIDERNGYIPDVTVQCGGSIDLDATTVPHPTLLVEVLSPSTQGADTSQKLLGYFRLPSVRHYLVVDPVRQAVIHHYRTEDGVGTGLFHEGTISLDPPGLEIEIADFFESLRSASR